jgi:hypothetical protein
MQTEYTTQQAQQYAKQRNKPTRFYLNVYGWNTYFTLRPTFATPSGKLKAFPKSLIIKP